MNNLSTIEQNKIQNLKKKALELEKMASLGLINAGIMHEIQNPLNFILNFSSMSYELLEELKEWQENVIEKITKDQQDDLESIISLIDQNMRKIEEHGKRINSIVKGMLEYSRGKKREKQMVKLNEMIFQYTGFSYHAMRLNTKDFNVNISKNFDKNINEIMAYHRDLGRAILNITNNAFFAVWERFKTSGKDYKPQMIISTKLLEEKVQISIENNGTGIPEKVKRSMFEPFFTTKLENQGTGLGLYITKEIVEKQHQGHLAVESEPGNYTRFIITIPIK